MKNFLFKIPNRSGKTQTIYTIGIIDASGSMENYWHWVAVFWNEKIPKENCITITFDTKARICPTNILSDSLSAHGGGGTKIPEAFQVFEQEINKLPENILINAVFISDGQDNYISQVEQRCNTLLKGGTSSRRINFICLGIQSGFPTFLSMKLRTLYHSGDENIPALYLIEYASEKAFFNKFETMKPYFSKCNLLDIVPEVRLSPWEKPLTEVYEDSWVLSPEDFIVINDEKIIYDETQIDVESLVDIFRGWSQKLQLISLSDPKMSQINSSITLKFMHDIIDGYFKRTGIDLRGKEASEITNYKQKVLRNITKNVGVRVIWFLNEVENLAKGVNPNLLNEFDAAKRLGIGTITGKHFQKALALKGITIDDFKIIRNDFNDIYNKITLSPIESSQEKSIISLQNQKEVFLDASLCEGLQLCKSQYDFIETFPIIGYAIKLKRFDGSMYDPWLTQVRFIAVHHKAVDSSALVANKMNLELPVEDRKEEINCVLPLFTEKDAELMPLINSRLFRLGMTFMVMLNVDTYYDEAYLALLANSFSFMFTFKENEWRNDILEKIYFTIKLTYSEETDFKQYMQWIVERNFEKIFYKKEENNDVHISLTKPIIGLYFLLRSKIISEIEGEEIFNYILMDFINRMVHGSGKKFEDFFYFKFQNEKVHKEMMDEMEKYYTISEFKKAIPVKVKELMKESDTSINLDFKILYNEENKVHLGLLERIHSFLFKKEIEKSKYTCLIFHCQKHKNLLSRFTEKVIEQKSEVKAEIEKLLNFKTIGKLKFYTQMITSLTKEFSSHFAKKHWDVIPKDKEELLILCKEKGVDPNLVKFKVGSGLPNNMCLSEKCEHYMKITSEDKLKKHLDGWQGKLPLGYHAFVMKHRNHNVEAIYESMVKVKGFNDSFYGVTKEFTLNYIGKVKEFYLKFNEKNIEELNANYVEGKNPHIQNLKVNEGGRGRGRGGGGRGGKGKSGQRGKGSKGNVKRGRGGRGRAP